MAIPYRSNYKPTEEQMRLHSVVLSPLIKTEVFFGGKKGVGKSAAGLGEAFMFALKYPKSKVCIIGETLDNVKESFLVKLPNLFPDKAVSDDGKERSIYTYYEKGHSFYPSRSIVFHNGSYITLQYCANMKDALTFQGKEFNLIIIDEVTRHEEQEINIIESTLRSSIQYRVDGTSYWIPTKLVLLGNPGGPGNDWVFKKYIQPCVKKWLDIPSSRIPIETKDYIFEQKIRNHDPVTVIRRFIQGGKNPFINVAYLASLENLSEKYKKQYLDGDWAVVSGRMFFVRESQKINSEVAIRLLNKNTNFDTYISIDWGYSPSYHSAHWHAVFPSGMVITFKELYGQDLIFEDFVKEIANLTEESRLEIAATLLPHDMYRHGDKYRDDSGKVIGEMKSDVFDNYGLNPVGVMSGIAGAVALRNSKVKSSTKINMPDGTPKFLICEDECPDLLEELEAAVEDDHLDGHVSSRKRNHAIDDYGLFLTYFSDDIAPEDGLQTEEDRRKLSRIEEMIKKHDKKKKEEEAIGFNYEEYYF